MKTAALLLANGFEEVEALGTVDILRRGNVSTDIVTINDNLTVTSSRGIKVQADKLFDDMNEDYDVVILPGGLPNADYLKDDDRVVKLLQERNADGKLIAAICASPRTFGKAGIAAGRKVTSYPDEDTKSYLTDADYQETDVCVDGNVITSRGPGTTFAFAYEILEQLGIDSSGLKKGMLFRG